MFCLFKKKCKTNYWKYEGVLQDNIEKVFYIMDFSNPNIENLLNSKLCEMKN